MSSKIIKSMPKLNQNKHKLSNILYDNKIVK